MSKNAKMKKSLYIPQEYLDEMLVEAKRQERSLSWIVKHAWIIARKDIQSLPAVSDDFFPQVKGPS